MSPVLLSLLALGCVDIFNPDGISLVMILLPIVKKRWHALLFAIAAYVAYVMAGIGIYFGVDVFLKDLYINLCTNYPMQTSVAKIVLGAICLVGCILMVIYLVRSIIKHKELSMTDMLNIRSVSPIFIVMLAFGSTWSQIFAFVPLMGFIGVLVVQQVSYLSAILWIAAFCIFASIPPVGAYILSSCIKGERFQKIMNGVSKVMTYVCFYGIPVLLAIGAWWGFTDGLKYFS